MFLLSSAKKIKSMSAEERANLEAEGMSINDAFEDCFTNGDSYDSDKAQDTAALHYAWASKLGFNSRAMYFGFVMSMLANKKMVIHLNSRAAGLAKYVKDACTLYAKTALK